MMRIWVASVLFLVTARSSHAQDGGALYAQYCSMCHDGGVARAPSRKTLREMAPERIVAALENGTMRVQGAERTPDERRALAVFLSGKPLGTLAASADVNTKCATTSPLTDVPSTAWNGWGVSTANDRYQANAGFDAADVSRLKVKWAFGFAGDASAAVQPAIVAGRVFIGSASGRIYSLGLTTGCTYWTFDADAQVRTALTVGRGGPNGAPSVFFGDLAGNVYALDVRSGELQWKIKADDHPTARITATPKLVDGRLYVAVSSTEEFVGADPRYPCCTFRGSVVALDASTGRQLWRTYTIASKASPTIKNTAGTQLFGPSGAAVWGSPTIDVVRRTLYVGTGDSYSQPAAPTSDAIIAIDLDSGAVKWVRQLTSGDAWNLACTSAESANCPASSGSDYDFGSPPILVSLSTGERRLIAAQKSGIVHGLDAGTGRVVWATRIGTGGVLGGIEWGAASDGHVVYVAVSDLKLKPRGGSAPVSISDTILDPAAGGGLFALRASDGVKLWTAPAPVCGERSMCSPAQSAPVTSMNGVVFSGSIDGHLRAYAAADGRVVWDFDTVREFETVNHVKASGGSIDVGGPAIAEGILLTTSGYPLFGGRGGNVLLAFSVDGK